MCIFQLYAEFTNFTNLIDKISRCGNLDYVFYLYIYTRPSAAVYGAFLRIYSVIIKVVCFWSLFLVMIHAACNILATCVLCL